MADRFLRERYHGRIFQDDEDDRERLILLKRALLGGEFTVEIGRGEGELAGVLHVYVRAPSVSASPIFAGTLTPEELEHEREPTCAGYDRVAAYQRGRAAARANIDRGLSAFATPDELERDRKARELEQLERLAVDPEIVKALGGGRTPTDPEQLERDRQALGLDRMHFRPTERGKPLIELNRAESMIVLERARAERQRGTIACWRALPRAQREEVILIFHMLRKACDASSSSGPDARTYIEIGGSVPKAAMEAFDVARALLVALFPEDDR